MRTYPEYKDSGVEWIGEIPKDWTTTKLKFQGDVIIGLSFDSNNLVDESEGILVLRASNVQDGKISFSDNIYVNCEIPEKLRVREGDILVCSRSGSRNLIGKNCLLSKNEEEMTWGVFMTVFRTPQYKLFYWLFNSQVFKSQSGLFLTSTINQLTVSTLENLIVSYVPNEIEQKQISDYLDRKTQQIDDLIEKTERKIELLKEQRSSLINQCVTKGLDPNVEMKDSGVEWIGEIPKGWEFKSTKFHFFYKKGSQGQMLTSTFLGENPGDYPVYSGQTENNGILGTWSEYEFDYSNGVIFVTTVGAKSMTNRLIRGKFSLSQNCLILIPRDDQIDLSFINYFLYYDFLYRKELLPRILQPSLRMEDIDQYKILVPPPSEQKQIADYLDKETSKIDQMVDTETKRIELLKEYRQSLISNVVTGKIDVRDEVLQ